MACPSPSCIIPERQKVTQINVSMKKNEKVFYPESGPDDFSEMTKKENNHGDECKRKSV